MDQFYYQENYQPPVEDTSNWLHSIDNEKHNKSAKAGFIILLVFMILFALEVTSVLTSNGLSQSDFFILELLISGGAFAFTLTSFLIASKIKKEKLPTPNKNIILAYNKIKVFLIFAVVFATCYLIVEIFVALSMDFSTVMDISYLEQTLGAEFIKILDIIKIFTIFFTAAVSTVVVVFLCVALAKYNKLYKNLKI